MGLYDKPDFGANKPAYDPLEAEKLRKLKPQLAAQENESIQQAPASAPIYPVNDPRNTQVTAARIGAGLAQKQPFVASSMNMPSATSDSIPANNQSQVMADAQPGIGYQLKSMPENEQTSSFAKFKQDGVTNYVGKGNPLTPEQQAKNDARLAQGNEMRARLGLGAMGANGRLVSSNAGVPEEFVSDGSFDPTQPGAIAGMAYLAKAAQIRAGIQNQNAQNTIAAQNAQTQAGLGASENAVRGIGILSAQQKMAQEQQANDLKNQLISLTGNDPATIAKRDEIERKLNVIGGHTSAQDMTNRVSAAKTILASMDASPEDKAAASAFLSGSLQSRGIGAQLPTYKTEAEAHAAGHQKGDRVVINGVSGTLN